MSRQTKSTRKEQLRDAALRYLLKHGVAKVSLRPLAAKLGTSPRILLFHFKSKEQLLQAVLGELHSRLRASLVRMASFDADGSGLAPLERFWNWAVCQENFLSLRLLYEAQIVAIQNPAEYAAYLKNTSMGWQAVTLRALSESTRSEPMATLCIAVFDGLFLELMSTGDLARLTRALNRFISIASTAIPVGDTRTPVEEKRR